MKFLARLLATFLLAALPAAATTLTGTFTAPDSSHPTGSFWLELSQAANLNAGGGCGGPASLSPGVPTVFTLTNGAITGPGGGPYTVFGNDCITPSNTYYRLTVITTQGSIAVRRNVVISGSSVDIGSLPAPISGGGGGGGGGGILSPIFGGTGTGSVFTLGSVVFAGTAGTYSQDNANFFYDVTLHRMRVGTSAFNDKEFLTLGTDPTTGDTINFGSSRSWGFVQGGTRAPANGFGIRDYFSGATRFSIDGSGNVGIGPNIFTPGATLEVAGTGKLAMDATNSFFWVANPTAPNNYTTVNYDRLGIGFSSNVALIQTSANGTGVLRPLQLTVGSATGIIVDTSGRVGVGVSPSVTFHVSGAGGEIRVDDTSISGAQWRFLAGSGGATKVLRIYDQGAGADRVNVDANGKVFLAEGTATAQVAQVGGALFTQTADVTVANTVTETTLIGSGTGSATLPANILAVGRTLRVTAGGKIQSTAGPTVLLKLKFGTTVIAQTSTVAETFVSSPAAWRATIECTTRTTGGAGTIDCSGLAFFETGTNAIVPFVSGSFAAVTIDTTTGPALALTMTWGAAAVGNTITATNVVYEVLN